MDYSDNKKTNIDNMSFNDFNNLLEILRKSYLSINSFSNETLISFFNSKYFLQLDDKDIKSIFLKANDYVKIEILDNEEVCKKILSLPPNTNNRYCFDLVDSRVQIKILDYGKKLNDFGNNLFENLLLKLDNHIFLNYITKLELSKEDETNALFILKQKYDINDELAQEFLQSVKQGKRNFYMHYKINSALQFYFYKSFNRLINFNTKDENEITIDNIDLSIPFLKALNSKHISSIMDKLDNISQTLSNEKKLLLTIKLYCLFGYDNAVSMINNKFTYMTDNSLLRIAETSFINRRRIYRLEHQNKFYSHDMIKNTIEALNNNNYDFFRNICFDNSDSYISSVLTEINGKLKEIDNPDEQKKYLISYMKGEIEKRENNFKRKFISDFIKNYSLNHKTTRSPISVEEIDLLFKNIDISKFNLDNNGRAVTDPVLINFLLGNLKKDNDCLLRLILNKESMGLNESIDLILNNFDILKTVVNDSDGYLSLYSIIDIMEISKAIFYDLAPDEQEINLSTISKIMHSLEHVKKDNDSCYRLNKAKHIFLEQKKKTSSSIPYVKGISQDGIKFKISRFDNPNLLTCGIDSENCLKIGGAGEEFLEYCLTSQHAAIIKIYDNNDIYICPIIRNGNGIYGNGIDPKPKDDKTAKRIINALKECYDKLISLSNYKEKIEFCSITDLHIPDFFKKQSYKEIDIKQDLSINGNFYSDFYKDGTDGLNDKVTSYILSSSLKYDQPNYYIPTVFYYQPRIPNYIYNINCELDKEKLEQQINSIYYNSINQKNISEKEKNSLKRNYKKIIVDDFNYIIGNKDWFIAIDNSYNIISVCLPYDKRAMSDYMQTLSEIKEKIYCDEIGSDLKK